MNMLKIREVIKITTLISIISIGIVDDIFHPSILNFIRTEFEDMQNLIQVIFQIQSTIAALSLAIISILVGVIDNKHYGVRITEYIMKKRPSILKHKHLLLISIFLVLASYAYLSFKFYSTVISLFIVTILITLLLLNDISNVFTDSDTIKHEIFEYLVNSIMLLNNTSDRIVSIIHNDICVSISHCEIFRISEDWAVLMKAYKNLVTKNEYSLSFDKKIKSKKGQIDMQAQIRKIENIFINVLVSLCTTQEIRMKQVAIDFTSELYSLINQINSQVENNEYLVLTLWKEVSGTMTSCINEKELLVKLIELRRQLTEYNKVAKQKLQTKSLSNKILLIASCSRC